MPGKRPIDLTNKIFGKWTVLCIVQENFGYTDTRWVCRCECGREYWVSSKSLRRHKSRRCRVCASQRTRRLNEKRVMNLAGRRFGYWLVVSRVPRTRHPIKWLCRCDCGRTGVVGGDQLREGRSVRCQKCADKLRTGRSGRYISVHGISLTVAQWAEKLGLTAAGVERRLAHMPKEKALSEPVRLVCLLTYNGTSLTVAQWSELLGRSRSRIYALVKQGCTVAEALGLEKE